MSKPWKTTANVRRVNEVGEKLDDTPETRADLWERYFPKLDPKCRRSIRFEYRYNMDYHYWTTVVWFEYERMNYYERKNKAL